MAQPPAPSNPHRSGVPGLFEDLPGSLNVLSVLAALQQTHLLLHPHAQALHHLVAHKQATREKVPVWYAPRRAVTTSSRARTCSAVLVTRPWCSLMACFWEKR